LIIKGRRELLVERSTLLVEKIGVLPVDRRDLLEERSSFLVVRISDC